MDTDTQPEPDPLRPVAFTLRSRTVLDARDSVSEPELVCGPGDAVTVTYGDAGRHRFVVTDAHGRWLAHGVLSGLDFHVESLSRGRRVLPVRAQPEPEPVPDPDTGARVHAHKHAHHAPAGEHLAGSGLVVERYDHTHAHAHLPGWSGKLPDDRQYHDDHTH